MAKHKVQYKHVQQSTYFLDVLGGYVNLGVYHNEEFWYRQITNNTAALISINTTNLLSDWIVINAASKSDALKIIQSSVGVTQYHPLVGWIELNIEQYTNYMQHIVYAISNITRQLHEDETLCLSFEDTNKLIEKFLEKERRN